ncbi:MAG: biotin transporter BioY [Lachnospiraceae bacterium]
MSTITPTRNKTLDMAYIAMFAVVMAVCAWISIPTTIPFTLQTFGVFLAVGILGGKRGTLSVLLYLLLGAIGIPVFAGFTGGVGIIAGSTGGYIVGFLFAALVMWLMEHLLGKKRWVLALSMVVGLLVCYAFGTIWFMFVYANNTGAIGLMTALGWCVFPYVIPDVIKIVLAMILSRRIAKIIKIH